MDRWRIRRMSFFLNTWNVPVPGLLWKVSPPKQGKWEVKSFKWIRKIRKMESLHELNRVVRVFHHSKMVYNTFSEPWVVSRRLRLGTQNIFTKSIINIIGDWEPLAWSGTIFISIHAPASRTIHISSVHSTFFISLISRGH